MDASKKASKCEWGSVLEASWGMYLWRFFNIKWRQHINGNIMSDTRDIRDKM